MPIWGWVIWFCMVMATSIVIRKTFRKKQITTKSPSLEVKQYTTTEPIDIPDQLRWKLSYKDETIFYEIESDSLWQVFQVQIHIWWNGKKRKVKRV